MKLEITKRPDWAKIGKNVRFGTALGLTRTAQAAQAEVILEIQKTFQTRGNWFQKSNKFGIRITAAKKTDPTPEAAVHTAADWLVPHETGATKTPHGRARFAVPTEAVGRGGRRIPASRKPRNLKNSFVLQTKRGPVLFQRLYGNRAGKFTARKIKRGGTGTQIVPMYGLEGSVKIKKRSTFYEPIRKVCEKRLAEEVREGIHNALRTMR